MNNTSPTPPVLSCPTCQKSIIWSEDYPHRPFCSHRCQLIDLGEWVSERYSIPESVQDGVLNGSDNDWG